MKLRFLISLFFSSCAAARAVAPEPLRPAHTYSIVARDSETGELGVAVQSHWFSVGSLVTWAEAGVGAVATQSFVNPAYGPEGLALMRTGNSAQEALDQLVRKDSGAAVRQVAFVDTQGRAAAHTGGRCIESARQRVGNGYSVQANMMLSDAVVPAMARAFEEARGELAERFAAALAAAQAAGGDIRGQQSAALLVVAAKSSGKPWEDVQVELRVEDHVTPVAELARLLSLHRAYEHMNAGDLAIEAKDVARARAEYGLAAGLAPDNLEIAYWSALTLAQNGELQAALPALKRVFAADANWIELTRRLPASGVASAEQVKEILAACGVR
jgi:uncharacterized Ntn-hydrolase superfamily protein